MAASTPRQAVEEFLDPFKQAALCVTSRPLLASGYRPSPEPSSLGFAPRDLAVPLDGTDGRRRLALFASHRFRIVERAGDSAQRWQAHSVGYVYDVLDRDGREVLTYHWHPEAVGPDFAHLHLSGPLTPLDLGPDFDPIALGDMHLPTSRMPFAAIVRLLILEFGIARRRVDWQGVLNASEAAERASFRP